MNPIIAVVIAYLASGTYNYAAADVATLEECNQKVAEIAHARLNANAAETDKVVEFKFKCVEFGPVDADIPKPKHIPGKDEASEHNPPWAIWDGKGPFPARRKT